MRLLNFFSKGFLSLAVLFALAFANTVQAAEGGSGNYTTADQDQFTISGVVSDASGLPVVGATVVLVNAANRGTFTDATGAYSLTVSPGDELEFSMMGYAVQLYTVGNATLYNVTLVEDAVQVDDVVVTALGIRREAKALGYSAQEVGGDALVEARQANVTNALSGMVPGLQVVKGAGATSAAKITLRGSSSLTGDNQPLIVIDGIPMDNTVDSSLGEYGSTDRGNGLSDINAEDIESMTVLKGGSAAALYGSRAGNGVILITTKSGEKKEGLGITVSAGVTIENALVYPEFQNTYSQGDNGLYDNLSSNSWGTYMDGSVTGTDWKGDNVTLRAYDNIDSFIQTGVTNTQNITLQQQYNKTSVYASVGRMDLDGMTPNNTQNRTNIVMRGTSNLGATDKWKLDVKMNYINTKTANRPATGIAPNSAFYALYKLPRSINLNDFNNPSVDESGNQLWWNTATTEENPWWTTQYNNRTEDRDRYIGHLSLSYQFTPWLSGEVKGGMDSYSTYRSNKLSTGGHTTPEGSYSESVNKFTEANYSFLFIAQKDNIWGNFGGSATFGGNMMDQENTSMSGSVSALVVPNVFSLGNGEDQASASYSTSLRKLNSLYGSVQMNWNGALFLDATLRNDWSSTMSKANRSYMYPSVSFAGLVSELVEMPSWFSFAKVRASYAEVGNDLDPYQLYNNYTISTSILDHTLASIPTTYYNEDLVSESIRSWEAGFDIRFLNNKLRLDASWYRSNAVNQLISLPMDGSSGYSYKMINAGNIQNEGFEVAFGADIMNTGGFTWDAMFNFSRNRSKIISLTEGVDQYLLGSTESINVVAQVGGGYGDIYGTAVKTVTDTSSPYYGQPILTEAGLPQKADDYEYLGNQQPDAQLSMTHTFAYKNISLGMQFDASIGGKFFSMTNAILNKLGNSAATTDADGMRTEFVASGVVEDGNGGYTVNTTPTTYEAYYGSQGMGTGNYGIVSPYIYDATSVRLRNISLGYNFPKRLLGNSIQKLNVSASCYNAWLIYSAVPGIDPEGVSGTGTNVSSLELGLPPTSRTFTFNVTIGF